MVIDTSAVLAILQLEPEAESFATLVDAAERRLISAVSVLEAGMIVQARKGDAGARALSEFLRVADLEVEAFDEEQSDIARDAYRRFGKGRHEAALNFGDCAAYALARSVGDRLLFKGDDFRHTDITAAVDGGSHA